MFPMHGYQALIKKLRERTTGPRDVDARVLVQRFVAGPEPEPVVSPAEWGPLWRGVPARSVVVARMVRGRPLPRAGVPVGPSEARFVPRWREAMREPELEPIAERGPTPLREPEAEAPTSVPAAAEPEIEPGIYEYALLPQNRDLLRRAEAGELTSGELLAELIRRRRAEREVQVPPGV